MGFCAAGCRQFQDIHSPDKLSDPGVVAGTLKVAIKKPRRKEYLYQKGDYESMRKDAFEFAKEKISTAIQILVQNKKTLT